VNAPYLCAKSLRVGARVAALTLLLLSATANESVGASPSILWNQQFGTPNKDFSTGVSFDGLGSLYVTGLTYGDLGGPNAGFDDSFVRKYDLNGNALWTRQVGSAAPDDSLAVSADRLGNVFFTGITYGALGGASAGNTDVFVGKYDSAGTLQWLHQLGSANADGGLDLSADGQGNVYVGGEINTDPNFPYPSDAFLTKFDSAGSEVWTRTLASTGDDKTYAVSVDGLGNVYAVGTTAGVLSGEYLAKYDASGNLLWIQNSGAGYNGVSADQLGDVFVGGTNGDALLSKHDSAGNLIWSRQFGSAGYDMINSVSADQLGNVYVTGSTDGSLGGPNAGSTDTFVAKYDGAGNRLWILQLGASGGDSGIGVAAGGNGIVYIAGLTGDGGRGLPLGDAFVAKIGEVPEPLMLSYGMILAVALGVFRRRGFSGTAAI
jgi:hypothetical protein